jgi:hypothetical protein
MQGALSAFLKSRNIGERKGTRTIRLISALQPTLLSFPLLRLPRPYFTSSSASLGSAALVHPQGCPLFVGCSLRQGLGVVFFVRPQIERRFDLRRRPRRLA